MCFYITVYYSMVAYISVRARRFIVIIMEGEETRKKSDGRGGGMLERADKVISLFCNNIMGF